MKAIKPKQKQDCQHATKLTGECVKCGNYPYLMQTQTKQINEKRAKEIENEVYRLLVSLKGDICDDYRASDDPEDSTPGMQVTVSTADMQSWNYQTGDNSYSGGCYGDPHWSVIYLYRRSNCKALATEAVTELADSCAEYDDINAANVNVGGY